jgi:uncharacterized protein YwbE
MEERRTTDLYRKTEQQLTAVASAVQRQDDIDVEGLSESAAAIADSVRQNDQLVVYAMAGPTGPPLVTNLVNVSILSAKVGAGLGYYGEELHRLVLAGLVHDVGLFAVPQSVVMKTGRLTNDERTLIEQHPELGYQLVHKAGQKWEWLAQVVRQAHERWNGQGYPNRLKGRHISELAQIIGVVDVFDALVTPRSYRRRFFPHEAVRELIVAERAAFPREVIKALVEQLSAYPLGTLVRLTTGEVGTVIGINADFPLRPVVEIKEGAADEGRQLDLSRSPLVSILETIESPDVARVTFSSRQPKDRRSKTGPSVSDQFSSLLESLDALASAIQGVVESRTPSTEAGVEALAGETRWSFSRPVKQDLIDAGFEKEVIGLFALEAHEWLTQIHSALKRLGEGANGNVRPKLYGIMLHGLTNLAKSAATVHQPAIERMASNLLPILHDVGKQEPRTIATALTSLQAGLDRIAAAVRRAAGDYGAEIPASPTTAKEEDRVSVDTASVSPQPDVRPSFFDVPSPAVSTAGDSLLKALRDLQQVRSRSMQPARDVLESVILRAERESGDLTVPAVKQILAELDHVDEDFLSEVRRRVPAMVQTLTALRQEGTADFVTASQLDPVVVEVEALHDVAGRVQAGMITMFLQGLRSFLLVAAYRKTTNLPQRLETIEGRVQALIPMAEQWVNIGRVERAVIADILPA